MISPLDGAASIDAFVRTLRSTSDTTVGPQHPAYDYHLTGQGDLVLTRLQTPSSVLEVPAGFERLLLVSTPKDQVLAELGAGSGRRIAVPAGTYKLRAWKGGQTCRYDWAEDSTPSPTPACRSRYSAATIR